MTPYWTGHRDRLSSSHGRTRPPAGHRYDPLVQAQRRPRKAAARRRPINPCREQRHTCVSLRVTDLSEILSKIGHHKIRVQVANQVVGQRLQSENFADRFYIDVRLVAVLREALVRHRVTPDSSATRGRSPG